VVDQQTSDLPLIAVAREGEAKTTLKGGWHFFINELNLIKNAGKF